MGWSMGAWYKVNFRVDKNNGGFHGYVMLKGLKLLSE